MYNPDALLDKSFNHVDSPEIACSRDRKEKLDDLTDLLHDVGYGVTRRGDRLTIRQHDDNGKPFHIEMVILEVNLDRDNYNP